MTNRRDAEDPVLIDLDRRIDELVALYDPQTTATEEFLGAQFEAGLAWVHFPLGSGGLSLPPALQSHVTARLTAAHAPSTFHSNPIGYGMAAPTIVAVGSERQQRRYLRPLFTSEEVWCQLFSEPGAGSDVAALATRAERDGDEWVVNGQKVWTTLGHTARFALLLARTDPTVPKHAGLTYFVLDMHTPGVEVRPLRQITGEAEFNEVYLTDARVPDRERLGGVGDGWRVAMTTLLNERFNVGNDGDDGPSPSEALLEWWRASPERGSTRAPAVRDRVVQVWVQYELFRLTNMRARQNRSLGTPGPEGSVAKLAFAEATQALTSLGVDLLGADGMLYGSYAMVRPSGVGLDLSLPQKSFLRSRALSIEAGSSEIMRNILGERILGLPPEPRNDREVPWNQVLRS